jgi:hypothetical protein
MLTNILTKIYLKSNKIRATGQVFLFIENLFRFNYVVHINPVSKFGTTRWHLISEGLYLSLVVDKRAIIVSQTIPALHSIED